MTTLFIILGILVAIVVLVVLAGRKKSSNKTPALDMNSIPELVLLFPKGKQEFGAELLKIQKDINHPATDFSRVLLFVTRGLFFDDSLAENVDAITKRIMEKFKGTFSLAEARYLADYILKRVQSTTAEQKFQYISAATQQTLNEANKSGTPISVPVPDTNVTKAIDTHKHMPDKRFIDMVLSHSVFILYENDNSKGNIYGWLQNLNDLQYTDYAMEHPTGMIMIYAIKWLTELYSKNPILYTSIIYNPKNIVDINVDNKTKSDYVSVRTKVHWATQGQLDDLYSLVRRYTWFCSLFEKNNNLIESELSKFEAGDKELLDAYPPTEEISDSDFGQISLMLICLRDMLKFGSI